MSGLQQAEIDALERARRAIERRRCSRRARWLRRHRWSGEAEKYWSLGMWDAQRVLTRMIREEGEGRG